MSARNSYNVAPIPGDNNGGSGGGGGDGPSADGGLPVGSVIPFVGATAPPKFLLCNGAEYNQANAEDLYDLIGYSFGVAPASTQISVGFYTYGGVTPNTISFYQDGQTNTFIKAGTYVKPSGMTANAGVDINGTIILITSAPAIGSSGAGSYIGTFVNPISGVGNGSNDGLRTYLLNRFSVPVPDLRLAAPIGAGTGIALGTSGGASTYQLVSNNLPFHRHGVFVPGSTSLGSVSGNRSGDPNVDNNTLTIAGETFNEDGTIVQNTAFSIRNPYVAFNYIIKAQT